MNQKMLFSTALALLLGAYSLEANAFWWMLRGLAAREVAATATTAARFCLRPVGRAACDLRAASSASEAVSSAVGPSYRIQATNRANVFQILDAAGNVIDLIEAADRFADQSVANLPQYVPSAVPKDQESPTKNYQLRHNGDVLNVHVNGTPTLIWSDGEVEVWADDNINHMILGPWQRLSFPNFRTIHAIPRGPNASSLFSQDLQLTTLPQQVPIQQQPALFPYGSNVACPQVLVGNGMARCQ